MGLFDDEISRDAAVRADTAAAERSAQESRLADATAAVTEVIEVLRECAAYLASNTKARSVEFGPEKKLLRKRLRSPEGFILESQTSYHSGAERFALLTPDGQLWSSTFKGPTFSHGFAPVTADAIADGRLRLGGDTHVSSAGGRAVAKTVMSHGDPPRIEPLAKYLAGRARLIVERDNR
ncbi:hypothetical protein ACNQR7_07490 [Mycolicibacterium senegalense]|uniref:hypothetical protein n=1 Tax=Mycolicibacterium senegalense TaxID=1796 RepID=UPI003AAC9B17